MSFPAGLEFANRRAERDGVYYFDCYRLGHPPGKRRLRKQFAKHADRETYISRHDAKYHDDEIARAFHVERSPTLAEGVGDFMQHIRALAAAGKRDAKTVKYYRIICEHLLEHLGGDTPLDTLGRRAALVYAKARERAGSTSKGARIVKEWAVVRRIQRFMDVPTRGDVPVDDISPEHRTREPIPAQDVRDFLAAMPRESVEYAFCLAKAITGVRNEELYAASVRDAKIDDPAPHLEYRLRNRQTDEHVTHQTYLPPELVAVLRPLIGKRRPTAPLFTRDGRKRLTPNTLRHRFAKASRIATARRRETDPNAPAVSITAVGQFRHELATLALDVLRDPLTVAEHYRHRDTRTTLRHYKLAKRDAALRASRQVTEAAAAQVEGRETRPRASRIARARAVLSRVSGSGQLSPDSRPNR